MFKLSLNTLLLLLLLSITSQSVIASFDNYTIHQTSNEHVNFKHQHDSPQVSEAAQNFECQHCCHCHSAAPIYLLLEVTDFSLIKVGISTAFRLDSHTAPILANLLRPPIF